MHRRNRHIAFSAKNTGADIVLDSRTIRGLGNAGSVTSWQEKSAAGRTFTSSGTAPTYRVNIQGGQPAVRFLTTGTYMSTSWSTNPTNYTWILTDVPTQTSGDFKHLVSTTDGSFNNVNFSVSYSTNNSTYWTLATDLRKDANVTFWQFFNYTLNKSHIQSIGVQTVSGTSTIRYFRENTTTTTTNLATNTTSVTLGGRNACCDYAQSDILQFLLFPSSISKSLRRRFEIASSLTFKIQDVLNRAIN